MEENTKKDGLDYKKIIELLMMLLSKKQDININITIPERGVFKNVSDRLITKDDLKEIQPRSFGMG